MVSKHPTTVFDLANLTPPDPPRRYWLLAALGVGTLLWLSLGLGTEHLMEDLIYGLFFGLVAGLLVGLVVRLPVGGSFERSAVSTHLTPVLPSTRRQLLGFLRRAGRGLVTGLIVALFFGLFVGVVVFRAQSELYEQGVGSVQEPGVLSMIGGIVVASQLTFGLFFGLFFGVAWGLLETRSMLITSRTPKEARSRSLIAALTWLGSELGSGVILGLFFGLLSTGDPGLGVVLGVIFGLSLGSGLALRNGGWFVLLQKVAHRRLARAGNIPAPPYDFLEWGIEQQIFRRVGGGVRFRHSLIQQHLANTSEGVS